MIILDCKHYKEMLISGANNLTNKQNEINKLNVFPVPDGDTGTNMNMTFSVAAKDTFNYTNDFIGDCAKFLSKNMLMNARGNSGVILSQVFKGIAKQLSGEQNVDVKQFAEAMINGSKLAYKAVMRPVEGTILTVVREASEISGEHVEKNPAISFEEYFAYYLEQAKRSLQSTPELLPVLKEAGVVDSGGAGFVAIIEGFNEYMKGNPVELLQESQQTAAEKSGYCTEIEVSLNDIYKKEFNNNRLSNSLSRTCNSIKLVRVGDTVRLHVHTEKPGDIVTTMQRFGTLEIIKIEKVQDEHKYVLDYEKPAAELKKHAIITVCNGEGIVNRFRELGAEYIINGGQTMNPATVDFVNIIKELNAENIYILPNNSNIIMAAKQAKDLCSGSNVTVIESRTIAQGIAACINFNAEADGNANVKAMNEAIKNVQTISVTRAVKNTSINGIKIKKNEYLGLLNGDIICSSKNLQRTLNRMIDEIKDDGAYLTVIYGSSTDEKTAQGILDYALDNYDIEGELINGKQDLYEFIIGVE